jgi:NADP-dependent 3-hydroxy acid dehydrogenase YdfG
VSTRLIARVIAITGASSGIGRACAERLARDGAAVVISARRTDRLDEIAAGITSGGGQALAVPGDVTCESDMRALVDRAVERFGRLDVMIANAGIGFHGGLGETDAAVVKRLVDVNILGTYYAARAAHDVFVKQQSGHIIAVSSIAGRRGVAGTSAYSATKAAQIGFIESLRAEYIGTNLHASVVYPISTATEFRDAMQRQFGRVAGGAGPRQSVDDVANAIAACIVSPRPEVYPYRKAWLLAVLSVVAPGTADRIVQKYGRRRRP